MLTEDTLYYLYLFVIAVAFIIGLLRYRRLDKASQIIVIFVASGLLSEIVAITIIAPYFKTKNPTYHFYNVVELSIITIYFLKTIKKYTRSLSLFLICIACVLGLANCMLLQPIETMNSNFITVECFLIIGMSFYALYKMLVNDNINLQTYIHFYFWIVLLYYFSATFCYWSLIKILYKNHSIFYDVAEYTQIISNIATYLGIGICLLRYPKYFEK